MVLIYSYDSSLFTLFAHLFHFVWQPACLQELQHCKHKACCKNSVRLNIELLPGGHHLLHVVFQKHRWPRFIILFCCYNHKKLLLTADNKGGSCVWALPIRQLALKTYRWICRSLLLTHFLSKCVWYSATHCIVVLLLCFIFFDALTF